tara:strand:- start:379 stop:516 length:138 start_codon:yes stop_codon:yes gene_type:complete
MKAIFLFSFSSFGFLIFNELLAEPQFLAEALPSPSFQKARELDRQ